MGTKNEIRMPVVEWDEQFKLMRPSTLFVLDLSAARKASWNLRT